MIPWLLMLALPQFVEVPAGSFVMGCPSEDGCSQVLPRRMIEFVRPFRVNRTEVTVEQFRAFIAGTGYKTDAEKAGDARTWRAPDFPIRPQQPVVFVTLNDATAYCRWVGGRVPTEAEWEYAARAGATTRHFWGDEIDGRFLWYRENSDGQPQRVARKRPNNWGLYDVEGNVWEWVTDGGPYTSIRREGFGSVRGGGFMTCPEPYPPQHGRRQFQIGLSVPFEGGRIQHFNPTWRRHDGGFRCVKD